MISRQHLNIAAGLTLAAIATAAAIWIIPGQAVSGDEGEVAPALLPILAAVVIAVFALVQVVTTVKGGGGAEGEEFDLRSAGFVIAAIAGLALSVAAIAWTGFRIGGFLTIMGIGLAMRPSLRVAVVIALVAIILPLASHTLAWHGLRLALP